MTDATANERYTNFLLTLATGVRAGEFNHVAVPVRGGKVVISEWLTAVALTTTFTDADDDEDPQP